MFLGVAAKIKTQKKDSLLPDLLQLVKSRRSFNTSRSRKAAQRNQRSDRPRRLLGNCVLGFFTAEVFLGLSGFSGPRESRGCRGSQGVSGGLCGPALSSVGTGAKVTPAW